MKKSNKKTNEGYALAAVLIASMILGIAGMGVAHKTMLQGTQCIKQTTATELLWQAQSGLEQAEGCFLQGDYDGDGIVGDNLAVSIQSMVNDTYKVTATATKNGQQITLQQDFNIIYKEQNTPGTTSTYWDLPLLYIKPDEHGYRIVPDELNLKDGIKYALGMKNNTGLENAGSDDEQIGVYGPVYAKNNTTLDSTLEIWSSEGITGLPDTHENEELNYNSSALQPIYDKIAEYDLIIDSGEGSVVYIERNQTLTLNNGETIILQNSPADPNATAQKNGKIELCGCGTVIIEGNLDGGTQFEINSENVTVLVGGDLIWRSPSLSTGTENVLYVRGDADIHNAAEISGSVLIGGYLTAKNQCNIDGFMFVEKYFIAKNKFSLEGVIATTQFIIKNNTGMILNRAMLPSWLSSDTNESAAGGDGGSGGSREIESIDRRNWEKV